MLPVSAAIFAFGTSFGALATVSGITPAAAVVMSATTFGGAAQFAAVSLLGSGSGAAAAVAAGALLNLRYLPMGMAAAGAYTGPGWRRALFAQLLGDESWALARDGDGYNRRVLVRAGLLVYLVWLAGTGLGAYGLDGQGQVERWGLDMASPAVFLVLLWGQLTAGGAGARRVRAAVAAAAALSALLLVPVMPPGVPIAVAASACLLGLPWGQRLLRVLHER